MIRISRVVLLALATLANAVCQTGSVQSAPAETNATNNVFAGTVTALTSDSLTVVRKVPAKADVSRTFVVDAQTKVEGPPMKVKARVTVRYQAMGEGRFRALFVIVR